MATSLLVNGAHVTVHLYLLLGGLRGEVLLAFRVKSKLLSLGIPFAIWSPSVLPAYLLTSPTPTLYSSHFYGKKLIKPLTKYWVFSDNWLLFRHSLLLHTPSCLRPCGFPLVECFACICWCDIHPLVYVSFPLVSEILEDRNCPSLWGSCTQ